MLHVTLFVGIVGGKADGSKIKKSGSSIHFISLWIVTSMNRRTKSVHYFIWKIWILIKGSKKEGHDEINEYPSFHSEYNENPYDYQA
jgi:hypothetical protein